MSAAESPSGTQSLAIPAGGRVTSVESASDWLASFLVQQGVRVAFGLIGGAVAPICEAMARKGLRVVQFRHETGAAFAAMEAYFATGHPAAVFTTTGPGLTNVITGVAAARSEGAKLLLLSGTTPAAKRGRGAFQETSPYTPLWAELYAPGPLFHFAAAIQSASELPYVAGRVASGLERSGGFVAHIGLPIDLQTAAAPCALRPPRLHRASANVDAETVERCVQELGRGEFGLWVGFGARSAFREVRELARLTGAGVLSTPRAKGIFPERHPQAIGVTGFAGHQRVTDYMRTVRPQRLLVLGTRLGEFTSFWDPELVPEFGFVHVDIDPEAPGAAYPEAPTFAVRAEVGAFLRALLPHAARLRGARARPSLIPSALRIPARKLGKVRPQYLMDAIQALVIDREKLPVLTEAGNSFAWANHHLKFSDPHGYRVSMGFASMGHSAAGVVGSALARGAKAVAILGDGAMLMLNEISTAVALNAPAIWVVLNDAQYGMIEHGMRAQGFDPVDTSIPRADFVAIARAVGADGARVESETDLEAALEASLRSKLPFVVDVWIDSDETAPFLRRIESLIEQGAHPLRMQGA